MSSVHEMQQVEIDKSLVCLKSSLDGLSHNLACVVSGFFGGRRSTRVSGETSFSSRIRGSLPRLLPGATFPYINEPNSMQSRLHSATPQTSFKFIYSSTPMGSFLHIHLFHHCYTCGATLFILARTATHDDSLDFLKRANKEVLP